MHLGRLTPAPAALGAILPALLLAACGSTASPSPEPAASVAESVAPTATPSPATTPSPTDDEAPAGWTRVDADGFSLAIPDQWESVSAGEAIGPALDAMREANPDAAAAIDAAAAAIEAGQVQLFAFDPGPRTAETGFAANVNVINIGDPGSEDLDELAEAMASGIRLQIPTVGEIESDTASLPAGEALILRYPWTVNTPDGGAVDVAVTQYLVLGPEARIVTMTGLAEHAAEDAATWRAMAESFRFE